MSILSVNNIGSRIATQIRQASFNPFDIESNMYMGEQVVAMYAYDIKPSSWSQLSWCTLGCGIGTQGFGGPVGNSDSEDGALGGYSFAISGRDFGLVKSFDYLLAVALESVFPQITLVNTPLPAPFTITVPVLGGTGAPVPLYYYVSTGALGLPAGTVYVGTLAALTSTATGIGVPITEVFPFVSYSPRHIVSWSQYAFLAAIESVTLRVNGVEYEPFDRLALFNALQYKTREDVYPIAVEQGTSFRAQQVSATVGTGAPAVLGSVSSEGRYKAFTVPFSFTTSALADRGQNGKHLSAFPLLLCCDSGVCVDVNIIRDLRELLVLQQEQLVNLATSPVVVVAAGGTPIGPILITSPTGTFSIAATSFTTVLNPITGAVGTAGAVTITATPIATGIPITVTFSPLTLGAFGASYLGQTGDYLPITRYSSTNPGAPLGTVVDYSTWIVETDPILRVSARALGATVTNLERGMMKADCRNKKFLYESYSYSCERHVTPGSEHCIYIERSPGQFKYAYTFAENETSRLQGQFFNFTNDTEFVVAADVQLMGTKFLFEGYDSIRNIRQRIAGYDDFAARTKFLRYVDNPLFAQRAPRLTGLHIVPRYGNWINSIYPDGSVNMEGIGDAIMTVRTTPSALTTIPTSTNFGLANTVRYNLTTIGVLSRIALFDIGE